MALRVKNGNGYVTGERDIIHQAIRRQKIVLRHTHTNRNGGAYVCRMLCFTWN